MNQLRKYLTTVTFEPSESPRLRVDPATRFGHIVGPDGKPERIDSKFSLVTVPTFDWQAAHVDEDEPIALVLQEAAMQTPLKLPTPKILDASFWIKNNRHVKAFLIHPSLHGKFFIPIGVPVIKSEALEPDRLTCLGPAQFAGYYVCQGHRRGVLAHDKKGLRSLQFASV